MDLCVAVGEAVEVTGNGCDTPFGRMWTLDLDAVASVGVLEEDSGNKAGTHAEAKVRVCHMRACSACGVVKRTHP